MKRTSITIILILLIVILIDDTRHVETSIERNKPALKQTIIGKASFELAKVLDPKTKTYPAERLLKAYEITKQKLKEKDAIEGITS